MSAPFNIPKQIHQGNMVGTVDPGNAGTIVVNRIPEAIGLISAGAETRTLARPTKVGCLLTLFVQTYVGNITLTVTGGFNTNGNTTFVFSAAAQFATFISGFDGTNYYWEMISSYFTGNSAVPPASQYVVATATLAVTPALHAGKTILLSAVAGFTSTLPTASGTFNKYRFLVLTSLTSANYTIDAKVGGSEVMYGVAISGATTADTPGAFNTASNTNEIIMALTTTGGYVGDEIILEDIGANKWAVRMFYKNTGSAASPFANH